MTTIGYAAMLEQFHPTELLDWCAEAEAAGLRGRVHGQRHFHPWTPQQGQSAFAWSFMGALGAAHEPAIRDRRDLPELPLPPGRHRQAAATIGAMYPGRFYLGLGAGEALNEHVVGGNWPEVGVRSAMLFESIEIVNKLFARQGESSTRAPTSRSRARSSTPCPNDPCRSTSRQPAR